MYRKRTSGSSKINERMARARAAKEVKRLSGELPNYQPELPHIRRRIIVEDYDCGETVRHEFVLMRSNRSDCYGLEVDGKLIPGWYGWAKTLELLRKAFPRLSAFS